MFNKELFANITSYNAYLYAVGKAKEINILLEDRHILIGMEEGVFEWDEDSVGIRDGNCYHLIVGGTTQGGKVWSSKTEVKASFKILQIAKIVNIKL